MTDFLDSESFPRPEKSSPNSSSSMGAVFLDVMLNEAGSSSAHRSLAPRLEVNDRSMQSCACGQSQGHLKESVCVGRVLTGQMLSDLMLWLRCDGDKRADGNQAQSGN